MNTTQKETSIKDQINNLLKSQPNDTGIKACLFNLIVYTQDKRRTHYFEKIVNTITSQFPCRIIFIQGNPTSKDNSLNIQITTEKSQDERNIVCDKILIEASGQDINRVYFLLFPLFVPDLPIYLLWGQDPTKEYTVLPHLQHFATRLIFDSETTDDLQQFSRDMLNRMNSSSIQIVDLNWARIAGWREILAHIFDSPERINLLETATTIKMVYNNQLSEFFLRPDTQVIYFQAWLASQLGWKFLRAEKSDKTQILHYQSDHLSHKIFLEARNDSNFETEEILEMDITGENYECHLKRPSGEQIIVQASNQYQCELPFTLNMPTLRSARSFMQEIFYQKASDQYLSMLKVISLVYWGS